MSRVKACSIDSLDAVEQSSHDTTNMPHEPIGAHDSFYRVAKVMGVSLLLGFASDRTVIITASTESHIEEVRDVLDEAYSQLLGRQESIQENFSTAFEDTIHANDILLEREIIVDYQSRMESFIQKGKKKIRF